MMLRRYWTRYIGLPCLFTTLLLAGCATTGSYDGPVLRAKEKVASALVHIRPVKEVYAAGKKSEMIAIGSGFIISPDGYIVTNEHVAGESSLVQCVLSDNREVDARVVGTDPDTDIAVLKLDLKDNLPWVKMGRSATLEAGQTVLALGSPHGLARSVSRGIVSVTNRYLDDEDGPMASPYNNFIQTDAAINPGNSGGPLVNLKGEVVGVNARILNGAENVGFAIPVDIVREVVDAIIRDGKVHRSWIGVTLQEITAKTDDPARHGVVVSDVDRLSPSAEAGLRPGDILVAVNDTPVNARYEEDLPQVRKIIADLPVDQPAAFHIERGEEKLDLSIKTEAKISDKGDQAEFTPWGITAVEVSPEIARRAQLPQRIGVLVTGVTPGGIAAKAGLQAGDILLSMDKVSVDDMAKFKTMFEENITAQKQLTMLFVQRGALTRFVVINMAAETTSTAEEESPAHE